MKVYKTNTKATDMPRRCVDCYQNLVNKKISRRYMASNRIMKFILATLGAVSLSISGTPPHDIPAQFLDSFTLHNSIPIKYWYFNNFYPSNKPLTYTTEKVNACMAKIRAKNYSHYFATNDFLQQALNRYHNYIENKQVGIIGSINPDYEAMVLLFAGRPITIEYNKIICTDPRIKAMTVQEYDSNPIQFEAILSISSFEHDGLGRYGDPIDPIGDLKAMKKCKTMLKPGGLLFLAIPVGPDFLVWNAHRIYGNIRLPILLHGWKIVDYFDCHVSGDKHLSEQPLLRSILDSLQKYTIKKNGMHDIQPIFVLTPE